MFANKYFGDTSSEMTAVLTAFVLGGFHVFFFRIEIIATVTVNCQRDVLSKISFPGAHLVALKRTLTIPQQSNEATRNSSAKQCWLYRKEIPLIRSELTV